MTIQVNYTQVQPMKQPADLRVKYPDQERIKKTKVFVKRLYLECSKLYSLIHWIAEFN